MEKKVYEEEGYTLITGGEIQETGTIYYSSSFGDSFQPFAKVTVNGMEISQKNHIEVKIHQSVLSHNRFEMLCPGETFSDKDNYPLSNSRGLLGQNFTIQLLRFKQTTAVFEGIITQVEYINKDKYPYVKLNGSAGTILMDQDKRCRSFENQTLKEIVETVTLDYKDNRLNVLVSPSMKEVLPFTVCYNETDFEFLQRLARLHGEYMYHNGQYFIFGEGDCKSTELFEGRDFQQYSLNMHSRTQKFTRSGYDLAQDTVHTVQAKQEHINRIVNPFQFRAVENSEKLFANPQSGAYFPDLFYRKGKEMEQAVERRKLSLRDTVVLTSSTDNPNLRLGDVMQMNSYIQELEKHQPIESYKIIEIEHSYTHEGYTNKARAVPVEQTIAPYQDETAYPKTDSQFAIVTDTNDSEGLNRIKVKFFWQQDSQSTPWIPVMQGHSGGGQGAHVIPELGHTVLIGFLADNAEAPIVLGSMYNGSQRSGYHTPDNDIKAFHTRSGTKRVADDSEGSVLEQDAAGSFIKWKGDGELHFKSRKMVFDADEIYFNVSQDMVLDVMKRLFIFTPYLKQQITSLMQIFSRNTLISSKEALNLQTRLLSAAGTDNVFIHSDKLATFNSKGTAYFKGTMGNNLTNTSDNFTPQPDETIALAVIQFRTLNSLYKGDFFFDWLRLNEILTAKKAMIEEAYYDILAGGVEKVTQDAATGKVDIHEYPDKDKAYEALQKEYEQIPITRDSAYTGTESTYFVPYLKLYSKAFSDAQKNTPPHPFEAELGIFTEVMEEVDKIEAECDGITNFSDKTLINITGTLFTDKTKHDKTDESNTIKITCNKDFNEDKELNFYAYPKGKTSKADRRLIGRIRLGANSAKVHKEIKTLLIPVKTNILNSSNKKDHATGKITNQSDEYLTRILNQAFITPKVEMYSATNPSTKEVLKFFDLSTDPDFQTGGKHIIRDKICIVEYDQITHQVINNRSTIFLTDIEDKFLTQKDKKGNLINEKYKDHFLVFIFGEDSNYNNLYGFVKEINRKSVVLFSFANRVEGGLAHEYLHGLGLEHVHRDSYNRLSVDEKLLEKNRKYYYILYKTDNVMGYNSYQRTIWHWQAKIINPNIK